MILGIDPGPTHSGWAILDTRRWRLAGSGEDSHDHILGMITGVDPRVDAVAVECVEARGIALDQRALNTCFASGGYFYTARSVEVEPWAVLRRWVKLHLAGNAAASDARCNQALRAAIGEKGTQGNPGPLYGISGQHEYDALAVALTAYEHMDVEPGKGCQKCRWGKG